MSILVTTPPSHTELLLFTRRCCIHPTSRPFLEPPTSVVKSPTSSLPSLRRSTILVPLSSTIPVSPPLHPITLRPVIWSVYATVISSPRSLPPTTRRLHLPPATPTTGQTSGMFLKLFCAPNPFLTLRRSVPTPHLRQIDVATAQRPRQPRHHSLRPSIISPQMFRLPPRRTKLSLTHYHISMLWTSRSSSSVATKPETYSLHLILRRHP